MTNFTTTSNKPSVEPTRTRTTAAALALVGFYQRLHAGRVTRCRFYPSCSAYAVEALEVHGALRGSWLAARRLLRCRPFGPHGVDLVPVPMKARSSSPCTR